MHAVQVRLADPSGLHARPAARLVRAVRELDCRVWLCLADTRVEVKSVLTLMTLGIDGPHDIRFEIEGPDARRACETITRLLSDET